MYGYGRHFLSFYRNPTILETVSDFDSSSWQLNLSTAQNDFSKFRPGWWQFCWMTGVKFNSIHSILVKFLHITQFTVCAAKNLTVFVADSPRCLEWSSMVAAVSRALRELSEPCLGWTREPQGQTKSFGARRQFSQATFNNVLPVMTDDRQPGVSDSASTWFWLPGSTRRMFFIEIQRLDNSSTDLCLLG